MAFLVLLVSFGLAHAANPQNAEELRQWLSNSSWSVPESKLLDLEVQLRGAVTQMRFCRNFSGLARVFFPFWLISLLICSSFSSWSREVLAEL